MNPTPIASGASSPTALPAFAGKSVAALAPEALSVKPPGSHDSSAPAPSPVAPQKAPEPSPEQTKTLVAELNAKLKTQAPNLSFQFDVEPNGSLRSIKLVDDSNKLVVLQIPSEEMLAIRDRIDQMIQENEARREAGKSHSMSSSALVGALFSRKA